jgi:hypothetical protein
VPGLVEDELHEDTTFHSSLHYSLRSLLSSDRESRVHRREALELPALMPRMTTASKSLHPNVGPAVVGFTLPRRMGGAQHELQGVVTLDEADDAAAFSLVQRQG